MIDPVALEADRRRQQQLLLAWFSPAFPIGGFAFSHGLEWAQEAGAVQDLDGLVAWLNDLIAQGSVRQDAILLCAAYRAADDTELAGIIDLAHALHPSRERALEAHVQGRAFVQVLAAAYPLADPPGGWQPDRITLPIAVGMAGAAHRIGLPDLALAYISGFVANLCSAAVRLGIVGQTDGQRAIAALHPAVARLAQATDTLTLDDLGSAALRSDLFSLQHETQYSRLFRS